METIGSYAFPNCDVFTEVVLPDSLTAIGGYAFDSCEPLQSVSFGNGLQTIGGNAFSNCTTLTAYLRQPSECLIGLMELHHIPYVVLRSMPFVLTAQADGGRFADGATRQEQLVDWQAALPQLEAPIDSGHLFSGWYLDAECALPLLYTAMPAKNLTLYAGWDIDCYWLTLNANGGTLTETPPVLLRTGDAPALTTYPSRAGYAFTGWYIGSVCARAFDGVMPHENLTLYAGWVATAVNGDYTFRDGEATLVSYRLLENESSAVYLPETVNGMPLTAIGPYAFADESITVLGLPASMRTLDENALRFMDRLTAIRVDSRNASLTAEDGVLFTSSGDTLLHYSARGRLYYALPASVRRIAAWAFERAAVQTVAFNNGLDSIERYAFAGSRIGELALPDSLTTIDACAFEDCASIYSVSSGEDSALPAALTVTSDTLTLTRGQTAKLSAAISPANATETDLHWSSGNERVAQVLADGTVRAIGGGSCVLYVATGNGLIASCALTVQVDVEAVSVTAEADTLNAGETLPLSAALLPANATYRDIVWSSDDERIATVDEDGLVTAVSAGAVTISARAHNGLEGIYPITVLQPIADIALTADRLAVPVGESEALVATCTPDTFIHQPLLWVSDNPSIATVDAAGLVTFVGAGEVTITATADDGNGVSGSITLTGVQDTTLLAAFAQSEQTLYPSTPLAELRNRLTVSCQNEDATETMPVTNYTLEGALTAGVSEITVRFGALSAVFSVQVTAVERTQLNVVYTPGELYPTTPLNDVRAMLTVSASCNDGSVEANLTEYTLEGALEVGSSELTVSLGNLRQTVAVTVLPVALSALSASFLQTRTVYTSATPDSLRSMLRVTAYYTDGSTAEVTDYTIVGAIQEGNRMLQVSWGGLSDRIAVKVDAVRPISLNAAFDNGGQAVYTTATPDDLRAHLTVDVRYNDGSVDTNVTSYTLSGTLNASRSTLTVTYGSLTTTFDVDVTAIALVSISAVFDQAETPVFSNSTLDDLKPMLTVAGTNNDGSSFVITDYELSGTIAVGARVITVTYEGKTTAFTVNVTGAIPIAFNHASLLLCPGDKQRIVATTNLPGMQDRLIVWTSSNQAVATVSADGLVTAINPGTATITAVLNGVNDASASCQVTVAQLKTMRLPGGLAEVRQDAFASTAFERIIAGDHLTKIASRAFKDCASLRIIELGSSVASIAEDAFEGCANVIIVCPAGSNAESYAKRLHFVYYSR